MFYQSFSNPYPKDDIAYLLYRKNWIDTVQWHYEDIIRDPDIQPEDALVLKRKIDASNQDRTDLVEYIDSYFLKKYQSVEVLPDATINTESPTWAIDRLSILALKNLPHAGGSEPQGRFFGAYRQVFAKAERAFGTTKKTYSLAH